MYSLVSAPVLGYDLARLQGGSAVAGILLRAMTLTPSELTAVAAGPVDDDERAELWSDVEVAAQRRRELREQSAAAELALGADPGGEPSLELAGALTVMERTPLGTVDGLLHCVRHDVLDWTWRAGLPRQRHRTGGSAEPARTEQSMPAGRATAVLCDALAAAYLVDLLPQSSSRRLAAAWAGVESTLPVQPADLGPQQDVIKRVLGRVAGLPAADLTGLVRASDNTRAALTDWAPAVHAASWAVFLSGRTRAAAAAQMLLVAAVDHAGITVADRAGGVWNLLSGAVQALVVRDLLDTHTYHRLLDPFLAGLGPIPRR
ncbi:MAG TPA: hypothetical protein VK453_00605 [Micromonosporaceae bacterium]|nr:hypothetical protein [Micromonosporaceae bacterium]